MGEGRDMRELAQARASHPAGLSKLRLTTNSTWGGGQVAVGKPARAQTKPRRPEHVRRERQESRNRPCLEHQG